MKDLLQNWKKFLIQESLEAHNVNGKVRVYHYSQSKDDTLTLDPEYFLAGRSEFTRNDFQASDLPRVFFYTNLDHAESIVKQGRTLFTTFVDTNKVYDMTKDPENLRKDARRWPTNFRGEKIKTGPAPLDIDLYLRSVAQKPASGMELVPLKNEEAYSGVFYKTGNMDLIAWFEPIEVRKFNPEDIQSPQDNTEEK